MALGLLTCGFCRIHDDVYFGTPKNYTIFFALQLGCMWIRYGHHQIVRGMMRRKNIRTAILYCAAFSAILFLGSTPVCPESHGESKNKIKVFVSILPQAYFVERVGGERVDVSVLVGPGYSPATYEPTPRQMAELGKAKVYFRIGVPFENVWIMRISRANPRMNVIDTRHNVELRSMKAYHPHKAEEHHPSPKEMKDPHIWLSLRLVKIQAQNICHALISEDPAHKTYYEGNLEAFSHDLDRLDAAIKSVFKNLKTRKFMAFHPAWGYFAHDYGLEQIPVEVEGKEPSARGLADLIARANQEGIKVVFVQAQFSTRNAETVARAIGGRIVQIDPLAKDYLKNMKKITETFRKVVQ
jgi:zinc transport system substrate-binding protein